MLILEIDEEELYQSSILHLLVAFVLVLLEFEGEFLG